MRIYLEFSMASKQKLLSNTLVACAVALALAGCGGGGSGTPEPTPTPTPPPAPDPVVPPETSETLTFVVTGNVVDSISGAAVSNVTLLFREDGQPSANVQDIEGNSITAISTVDGTFAFTLSGDSLVENLVIAAEADGFIDKSASFDLSDTAADIAISLAMVANDAQGVAVEVVEETIDEATVEQEIVAGADTDAASVEVVVPAGTQLQDVDGNPVEGTSVSIEVTVVDVAEDTSGDSDQASVADVLPAGLNSADSDTIEVPIGVANVEMVDDQGNEIEQFSQPIRITISLANDGIVQEGDVYNLQSYDEDTGVWTDEDNDAVVGALDDASNTFPATFEIDHLTFFAVTTSTPACTSDIVANFTGDPVPTTGLFFKAFSEDASFDVFIPGATTSQVLFSADRASSFNIASTATARVRVRDVSDFVWYDSSTEVAVCGAIPATLVQPNTLVEETFTVTATCSNDSTVVSAISGGFVTYNLEGKTPIPAQDNGDGTYSLADMVQGSEYIITVDPRISDTNGTVPVPPERRIIAGNSESDPEDYVLDLSISCAGGTGAG